MHLQVSTLGNYAKRRSAPKAHKTSLATQFASIKNTNQPSEYPADIQEEIDLIKVSIINIGKHPPVTAKNVVIVGAGIAGMVAASVLSPWMHVEVVEADDRYGGRIRTKEFNFEGNNADCYVDYGPMRYPVHPDGAPYVHPLLYTYLKGILQDKIKMRPFITQQDKCFYYVNGKWKFVGDYKKSDGSYASIPTAELGFPVGISEGQLGADELFSNATENIPSDYRKLKYDEKSIRSYLKEDMSYSEGAIEAIGVCLDEEALMFTAFMESISDQGDTALSVTFEEMVGGSHVLAKQFYETFKLERLNFKLNHSMTAITQTKDKVVITTSPSNNAQMTHTVSKECHLDETKSTPTPKEFTTSFTGDYALVTIPFSRLKLVDTSKAGVPDCETGTTQPFSSGKRKAIRELHYDNSTKIALAFTSRWWVDLGVVGGGASVTDLPVRYIFYPSHYGKDEKNDGGGVLLASYTWSDDALAWTGPSDEEAVKICLDNIVKAHSYAFNNPNFLNSKFTEQTIRNSFVKGERWSWTEYPYANGAFCLFSPGQQTELYENGLINNNEGRVYFAGEHASLIHAWIEGAMQSSVRECIKILDKEGILWRNFINAKAASDGSEKKGGTKRGRDDESKSDGKASKNSPKKSKK